MQSISLEIKLETNLNLILAFQMFEDKNIASRCKTFQKSDGCIASILIDVYTYFLHKNT